MQSNALTVKWVQSDGGASWFPTDAVVAIPSERVGGRLPIGVMRFIDRVEFARSDDSGVRASISSGTVYIMNAAGKTIDTIQLGLSEPRAETAPEAA